MVDDYAKELLESVYKVFDVLHMNITGEYDERAELAGRENEVLVEHRGSVSSEPGQAVRNVGSPQMVASPPRASTSSKAWVRNSDHRDPSSALLADL